MRLAANATGDTWRSLRRELDRLPVGEFAGNSGRVLQRTKLSARQCDILRALDVAEPGRFLNITPS